MCGSRNASATSGRPKNAGRITPRLKLDRKETITVSSVSSSPSTSSAFCQERHVQPPAALEQMDADEHGGKARRRKEEHEQAEFCHGRFSTFLRNWPV